ncbi:iron uptake transporter deferrochelatase/peroxidase subunit [Pengzhenrongella frigida]|uniref:Deferrochelatase n=1 Tax=Pengzhenrongella frigida TaxID=1259133 RepID=A0A4Q5N1Q2_9MICO|nr:iron uptake transporter deferrochelatase/peroxidase subunit [Cellulomonas sp. HLT2-17]RYV52019.1 deferrochelatase/peroxidase EfeB [Cellulomonas sp. HLT2-17]
MVEQDDARPGVSRRAILGWAGAAAAVGIAGAGGVAAGRASSPATGAPTGASRVYPFTGAHQAGIVTPAQDRLHFATWDLTTTSRDDVIDLLRRWTTAAARLTQGLPAGEFDPGAGPYDSPPDDTGEAADLAASGLTLTFGFGGSLFSTADGTDRFGLAARRPAALADLPHFPGDQLEAARTGGDLAVQACADDPQVAVHAIRNLSRLAFGTAAIRWSQLGYGRTSSTSTAQRTPRNLFGFKDGTANLMAEEPEQAEEHLWVAADDDAAGGASGGGDTAWMTGGSYLVARRIRMTVETWDRSSLREQEQIVGRTKGEGAPLSGGTEHTDPDFAAGGRGGEPLIPIDSHVRLAHPSSNGGARMLRRGYNYTDGSDGLGRLDAGLFFLAYVRDPRTQYTPMQTALARDDAMSEYLRHTGSGLWAVPPGVPEGATMGTPDGAFVGQGLFT